MLYVNVGRQTLAVRSEIKHTLCECLRSNSVCKGRRSNTVHVKVGGQTQCM